MSEKKDRTDSYPSMHTRSENSERPPMMLVYAPPEFMKRHKAGDTVKGLGFQNAPASDDKKNSDTSDSENA